MPLSPFNPIVYMAEKEGRYVIVEDDGGMGEEFKYNVLLFREKYLEYKQLNEEGDLTEEYKESETEDNEKEKGGKRGE